MARRSHRNASAMPGSSNCSFVLILPSRNFRMKTQEVSELLAFGAARAHEADHQDHAVAQAIDDERYVAAPERGVDVLDGLDIDLFAHARAHRQGRCAAQARD